MIPDLTLDGAIRRARQSETIKSQQHLLRSPEHIVGEDPADNNIAVHYVSDNRIRRQGQGKHMTRPGRELHYENRQKKMSAHSSIDQRLSATAVVTKPNTRDARVLPSQPPATIVVGLATMLSAAAHKGCMKLNLAQMTVKAIRMRTLVF